MLKNLLILPILFSLLLFSPNIIAGTTAKGRAAIFNKNEAAARKQAILNAQREAVEKGVGILIDSKTITENWQLLQDEVYTSARGFVTSFKIIEDKKSPDGNEWLVTIDAQVASASIKNKLEELRILHKKMGHKSYAVYYSSKNPNSIQKPSRIVSMTSSSIQETFTRAGFRVFHIAEFEQSQLDFNRALKLAQKNNIDILLKFEILDTSQKADFRGLYVVKSDVKIEVWDAFSGRFIANAQSSKKNFIKGRTPSRFQWEKKLANAGKKAAAEAAQECITKTVDYYVEIGDIGSSFMMIFENFTEDTEDEILKSLENLEGFQSLKEMENRPGYLRVEYFTSLKKSRLRRSLRNATKKEGISLMSKEISGNRLHFVKPGTE